MILNKTVLIITLFLSLIALSLKNSERIVFTQNNDLKNRDTIVPSRALALQYCQSCHIFPEPYLLDKKTWTTGVLPNMAMRLGIKNLNTNASKDNSTEEDAIIKSLNIYPDTQIISTEDWLAIVKFYENEAPNELPLQKSNIPIVPKLPQFQGYFANFSQKKVPKTTLLKFDKKTSQLYIGDAQNELIVIDSSFNIKNTYSNIESAPVDIDFPVNASPRLLTIGSMAPSDLKTGRLCSLDSLYAPPLSISQLQRPVQFVSHDLNRDGKEDLILCQFGNNIGKLSWFDDFKKSKENILKAVPGARKVEIADFNNDKKPDIMVLMAQAYEGISIFYNQGKGIFKEKPILRLPPVYGVSYFELADFNKDGFQDILLTNGDNWDYSAIRKPYHGIRIYLNDGRDNFKETWFYPMYGASKAVARDFDKDGDLDIAAISFYTELDLPEQNFIYLSNIDGFNFKAYSTPEAAQGKWLTMEVGDFDHDGFDDICLGSYFHTMGEVTKLLFRGIESLPQLLFLMNKNKNSGGKSK